MTCRCVVDARSCRPSCCPACSRAIEVTARADSTPSALRRRPACRHLASQSSFAILPALARPSTTAAKRPKRRKIGPVSYYRHVRPILQRSCSGCHQPAKRGGKLLLTSYDGLKNGGESGARICRRQTRRKPHRSIHFGRQARNAQERRAAEAGPGRIRFGNGSRKGQRTTRRPACKDPVTAENPPKYASPPVIAALAYSPDSSCWRSPAFTRSCCIKRTVRNSSGG